MAIALSIIALVIGILIPAFLGVRAAEQLRVSDRKLETALQAIAAFAQANGCVPCPTPPLSVYGAGHGVVRGDAAASPAPCGLCATAVGVLPFRSLGLPEDAARDGYGDWLTYAVDANLAVNFNVVPPASPCRTGDADPPCNAADIINATRKKGLCQGGLSSAARLNVQLFGGSIQKAAVLVLSHGANRRGAYVVQPKTNNLHMAFPAVAAACTSSTGAERCNADDDINFVATLSSGNGTDPFDDRVMYLDRNALVSYLGGAACQTVW